MMKKYVNACKHWAGLFSFGKHRYLWNTPSVLHFGDWVAADVPKMSQWQKRTKWTATASLCNTSHIVAKIAGILGMYEDEKKYSRISRGAAGAYNDILTDGNGKLKEEFQTAYVLPLYFNMFDENAKKNAVDNLVSLVEKNNYCIGTGFPGTPYILFALADNGREDVALKMLLNDRCPSWLHEVKMGATTIWERWDGLNEEGVCPISDDGTDMMISYNHYASGAVGDFLYRRIAGIEATEAGYKCFRIKPIVSEAIKWAKGTLNTPFGEIISDWKLQGKVFTIDVKVPVGCECELCMPDGNVMVLDSGKYERKCNVNVG
jgi:alpha-L-rhamnosidase